MPWEAIKFVTGGVTLAAFAIAAILVAYRRSLLQKERLINSVPADQRAPLVDKTLEFFNVDAGALTRQSQFELAIEQIRARMRRHTINATLVLALALLTATVTVIAIIRDPKQPDHGGIGDGYSVSLPGGLRLRDAIKILVQQEGSTADFKTNCSDSLLNTEVEAVHLKARTMQELLELLRFHLKSAPAGMSFRVKALEGQSIYEISCSS